VPKNENDQKVTTSQDDDLVGVLKNTLVGCAKNQKNHQQWWLYRGAFQNPVWTGLAELSWLTA
jgi:hypothetical protein